MVGLCAAYGENPASGATARGQVELDQGVRVVAMLVCSTTKAEGLFQAETAIQMLDNGIALAGSSLKAFTVHDLYRAA